MVSAWPAWTLGSIHHITKRSSIRILTATPHYSMKAPSYPLTSIHFLLPHRPSQKKESYCSSEHVVDATWVSLLKKIQTKNLLQKPTGCFI